MVSLAVATVPHPIENRYKVTDSKTQAYMSYS